MARTSLFALICAAVAATGARGVAADCADKTLDQFPAGIQPLTVLAPDGCTAVRSAPVGALPTSRAGTRAFERVGRVRAP